MEDIKTQDGALDGANPAENHATPGPRQLLSAIGLDGVDAGQLGKYLAGENVDLDVATIAQNVRKKIVGDISKNPESVPELQSAQRAALMREFTNRIKVDFDIDGSTNFSDAIASVKNNIDLMRGDVAKKTEEAARYHEQTRMLEKELVETKKQIQVERRLAAGRVLINGVLAQGGFTNPLQKEILEDVILKKHNRVVEGDPETGEILIVQTMDSGAKEVVIDSTYGALKGAAAQKYITDTLSAITGSPAHKPTDASASIAGRSAALNTPIQAARPESSAQRKAREHAEHLRAQAAAQKA